MDSSPRASSLCVSAIRRKDLPYAYLATKEGSVERIADFARSERWRFSFFVDPGSLTVSRTVVKDGLTRTL